MGDTVRTRELLDLIGTDRGTLHRYATALHQIPGIAHGPGHPYEWSPGSCAAIYTSWQLCHASNLGPASTIMSALVVGAAYDSTWTVAPMSAPTWVACTYRDAYTANSATDAWRAAGDASVVRIVALIPLKEALMADRPDEPNPYVVTVGFTRRLVHAATTDEAKAVFLREVVEPLSMAVGDDELTIRHATIDDLNDFEDNGR